MLPMRPKDHAENIKQQESEIFMRCFVMEFSSCIARCAEPLFISDNNTMFLDQILVLQDKVHLPR